MSPRSCARSSALGFVGDLAELLAQFVEEELDVFFREEGGRCFVGKRTTVVLILRLRGERSISQRDIILQQLIL